MSEQRPGRAQEIARTKTLYRTIPKNRATVAVTTSAVLKSGVLAPFAGQMVYLVPDVAVSIMRGDDSGSLSVDNGFQIDAGKMERVFVDPYGNMDLTVIGGAAGNLFILDDPELVNA